MEREDVEALFDKLHRNKGLSTKTEAKQKENSITTTIRYLFTIDLAIIIVLSYIFGM